MEKSVDKKDLLYWFKEIEINDLNNKFKNEISNFDFLKKEYIGENLEIYTDKIKLYLKENEEKIKNDRDLDKEEINIFNIWNWMMNLYRIENFFKEENIKFNKMWKYKILYFIYGGFIYMSEYIKKNNLLINLSNTFKNSFDNKIKKESNEKFFFENENNVKWFAFKNGPITSHYNYLKDDEKIIIDFEKINYGMKKILEGCYLTLNSFSLEILIEESHKTEPWLKKWNNQNTSKFMIEMDKNEIINYFKENPPFYMKKINEWIQNSNYRQNIKY